MRVRRAVVVACVALAGCGAGDREPPRTPPAARVFLPPPGVQPGAPVVVWGGSRGGRPDTALVRRLAADGHPAMALAYFGLPGLPRELERIPLEYFARAIRAFDRRRGVDGRRMVVYGVSRGSEAALLMGVHFPRLVRGVVAIVPSSKVNGAVHGREAAWTLRGKPLTYALAIDAKGGFDAPAVIPVERIRGPILLAAGTRDRNWPSAAYTRAIVRRIQRRHGPAHVTAVIYRGAGHDLRGHHADLYRRTLRLLDAVSAG